MRIRRNPNSLFQFIFFLALFLATTAVSSTTTKPRSKAKTNQEESTSGSTQSEHINQIMPGNTNDSPSTSTAATYQLAPIDAIIIGSGLAGLTTALTILDAGGRVTILEKEAKLGGNSMKASSGINYCNADDKNQFRSDTLASAGKIANAELIDQLVQHSEAAVQWLQDRIQADLSHVSQLGGHSTARTHRPGGKLPVGAELMIKMQSAVRKYEEEENERRVTILTNTKATQLLQDDKTGRIIGVSYETRHDTAGTDAISKIYANHVVLATGGFAADRSKTSWLARVQPHLLHLGATAGPFSTGDGLSLGTQLGANLVDMQHIQVHPTGFIDPNDPTNPNKFLAAEVLRGVGGILLTPQGKRFCNEIGRRDYVTDQIFSLNNRDYAQTKQWKADDPVPQVFIVVSEQGAASIQKHIDFYVFKQFLSKVTGFEAMAEVMNVSVDTIRQTLLDYQSAAAQGHDAFGKTRFLAVPSVDDDSTVYIGKVEPVLHYCMGGLQINPQGQVLLRQNDNEDEKKTNNSKEKTNNNTSSNVLEGLWACGEVTGGLHGENRLAGNSLCECVVFGRLVGQSIASGKNGGTALIE